MFQVQIQKYEHLFEDHFTIGGLGQLSLGYSDQDLKILEW